MAGGLSGAAATIYVAQYRNVEMTTGGTLALDAIVAAVLGGCSVAGGRASLLGTALGVVLLRVAQNGMVLLGLASLWSSVVEGMLLIAVLSLERCRRPAAAPEAVRMSGVAGRKLLALAFLWALLLALFSITIPSFFQASTLTSILQFSAILALVTLGQTLVVLAGGGGSICRWAASSA